MIILEPREHFFSTLIGLELQKAILKKMWESGQLPHTLLFAGPPLVGKRSLAFALSKYINCETEQAKASTCICRTCTLISRGIHPDIFVVEPTGATHTIQIEQLREVQEVANIAPIEAKRKIIIFANADQMNPSAANSALKLLEEPPSYLLLILVSSQPHRLLPTVKSRCMQITLTPATEPEIERWLVENLDISDVTAKLAAGFSAGIPGMALELARRNYIGRRDLLLRELDSLLNNGFPALFSVADELAKRFNKKEITELLLGWFRDLLVARYYPDCSQLLINKDAVDDIERVAQHYSTRALFEAVKELLATHKLTQRVINKRLFPLVLLFRLGKLLKTT